MAITIDWINKIVNSTSNISDLPSFKDVIRDLEDDATGMLYQPIITYKRIDLGGGAYFHAVDFINGYRLKFPNAGAYEIVGNLNAEIIPISGVYVERKTSVAFATSNTGGGSPGNPWSEIIEGTYTAGEIMRMLAAIAGGKTTITDNGNETATVTFRDLEDTTDRVIAQMEGSERTNINLDL
jgi:hypothetical protein